jgi:hypothetical protein
MKIKFLLLASLLFLNTSLAFGADPVCSYFYRSLLQLPHTKLTQNINDFLSLWNGQRLQGCEVVYKSHESLVYFSNQFIPSHHFFPKGNRIDADISSEGKIQDGQKKDL